MKATITDLRYRTKDVLHAIGRGDTVTVLYRGKEIARMIPAAAPAKTSDPPLFGLWRDREDLSDPWAYIRALRQPRAVRTPQ